MKTGRVRKPAADRTGKCRKGVGGRDGEDGEEELRRSRVRRERERDRRRLILGARQPGNIWAIGWQTRTWRLHGNRCPGKPAVLPIPRPRERNNKQKSVKASAGEGRRGGGRAPGSNKVVRRESGHGPPEVVAADAACSQLQPQPPDDSRTQVSRRRLARPGWPDRNSAYARFWHWKVGANFCTPNGDGISESAFIVNKSC